MKNRLFKIFSHCIPVKGANRSVIYDLNRNDFELIPNTMVDFIERSTNRTFNEIIKHFGKNNEDIIEEYLYFLESKEFCFWIEKNELDFFPKMELDFDYPSIINNCVIEIDNDSLCFIETILIQLKTVHCHHVSLMFNEMVTMGYIKKIVEKFYNSNIKTIQLVLQNNNYKENSVENILKFDIRIIDVYITCAKLNSYKIYGQNRQVTFSTINKIDAFNSSYRIYKKNFIVNIFLFAESLKYNNYYNKKVSITKDGYIKNCLLNEQIYGNIQNQNLKLIVESKEFQYSWNINKDNVKTCQDCEFRYMCIDASPLIFNKDENIYYRSVPCNYNPYKSEFYD